MIMSTGTRSRGEVMVDAQTTFKGTFIWLWNIVCLILNNTNSEKIAPSV